jgi:hypothetical protein
MILTLKKRLNPRKLIKPATLTVLLIAGILTAYGQDPLLIKGTVVDGSNRPVANVSVGIEGSAELPVVSDSNGIC